jgi:hypothetical protein
MSEKNKKIKVVTTYKIKHNTDDLSNYRITEDGKVYSKTSKKFLKNQICNGYELIDIQQTRYTIHRLVAMTFIPTDNYDLVVDHIDTNKLNNHKDNLQWITQKENVNRNTKETSHPRKVIQKNLNGEFIKEFDSVTEAGTAIGVTRHAISKACLKVNKTCGGFIFDFKDEEHSHKIINIDEGVKAVGYDNYIVFKDGTIYNTMRKAFVKPILNKAGYTYVTLCKNKDKKNFYVQKLVATAFCENNDKINKTLVNHINKNRSDNNSDNLEWVTPSESTLRANNKNII